ncbi:replication-relaxation family protein [Castellaniella sp. MT123]|uniref:replication-relaxation family protein n=1 Tax=Castellaniella sp. MT123 TaxID=3140381 RepID=UPI0031F45282
MIALDNELRVLRAIRRFAWLRTRDIAVLVWRHPETRPGLGSVPGLQPPEPTATELRMAQKTLARLREKRQVLHASAPDYSRIYALAEAGVRVLRAQGADATTGKDAIREFSLDHYHHRRIANEVAIAALTEGYKISTERETAQGRWIGGRDGIAGKIPDALIRTGSDIWWVEVEHSRKNVPDYQRLLVWLTTVRRDALTPGGSTLLGKNMHWRQIIFVCTPTFQKKLTRDLQAIGWTHAQINMLLRFSTALYRIGSVEFQR